METWFWILVSFLSILTMIGNGFVIFVVYLKRQLRTKTNAFIVSLAVADFCVAIILAPSVLFCHMVSGCNSKGVLFNVITFILELFTYASGINLCSLVLDRYMAVAKPLSYLTFMKRRGVVQMISLSWTFSVAFNVILSSLRYSSKTTSVRNIAVYWFYVVFELSLCGIVIFCFTSMLSVVCRHDRSARRLAKQVRFNHQTFFKTQDKSAFKMMAIVVCLFLVSYGLLLRCSFVLIFSDQKLSNDRHYKTPIVLLNSAVNPLAYAIFKRDIKKEFRRLISKRRN